MKFDFSSKEQLDNTIAAYEETIKENEARIKKYPAKAFNIQEENSALQVRVGQLKQESRKWRKTLK